MRPSIIGKSLAESDNLLQQMDLESWQLTTLHLFVNILFLPSLPDHLLIVDPWNGPIGSQRLHVTSPQLCLERILPSKIDNCSDFYDLREIVRFRKSAPKAKNITRVKLWTIPSSFSPKVDRFEALWTESVVQSHLFLHLWTKTFSTACPSRSTGHVLWTTDFYWLAHSSGLISSKTVARHVFWGQEPLT